MGLLLCIEFKYRIMKRLKIDEEDKLNNESLSGLGQRGGVDLNYPHRGKRKKKQENKMPFCREDVTSIINVIDEHCKGGGC